MRRTIGIKTEEHLERNSCDINARQSEAGCRFATNHFVSLANQHFSVEEM
jgi:hypothetical protein